MSDRFDRVVIQREELRGLYRKIDYYESALEDIADRDVVPERRAVDLRLLARRALNGAPE